MTDKFEDLKRTMAGVGKNYSHGWNDCIDFLSNQGRIVPDGTIKIYVGHGQYAFIDFSDYELVCGYWWRLSSKSGVGTSYAITHSDHNSKERKTISMHRLITGVADDMTVDHINGNGLDNRRSNLRVCTKSENSFNKRKYTGTSRYKGVCFEKDSGMWRATIAANGKKKCLGRYADQLDAAIAYDNAAREIHGEFAKTNFGLIAARPEVKK